MKGTPLSDAELVERCRGGDHDAWCELVTRFSRYVYAVTRAFRLSDADAEDVFQDVFAKAYERLGTLRSGDALRPWLGQLTRRACIDSLRGPASERHEQAVVEVADPTDRLAELDEAFVVHAALAELSGDCQEILDRFFSRDESYRTIGEALNLPAGTIASRISRCLAKLREQLGEEVAAHARLVVR
jgi:RNA polymerase sigma factor (sigma-70 family)